MLTFATLLALGVVAFVAAPWMAHRLRRRMADESSVGRLSLTCVSSFPQ